MYGDIQLFAGSGCPELAQRISDYIHVPLSDWDIIQFSNQNLFVRLQGSVRGQDVYLIQTHADPLHTNIMEMLIAIDCLKRDSAGRITVVSPFLAYSQSDKKDQPRVPITARLLADIIETAGADRWMTMDLHSSQIQGFYKIPGDSLTSFHILVRLLSRQASGCSGRYAGSGICEARAQFCRGPGIAAGLCGEAARGQ